ncbi:MAG: hypothetical protein AB7O45_10565 [Alphaproteobacteria bacterium]
MPRVRFLETRVVQDSVGMRYEAGEVYDLPGPSAERWIRRGVAELVATPVAQPDEAATTTASPPPPHPLPAAPPPSPASPPPAGGQVTATNPPLPIPPDWQQLDTARLRDLARLVGGQPVANRKAAAAVIEAELKRRAG